jgi:hypothetical protein
MGSLLTGELKKPENKGFFKRDEEPGKTTSGSGNNIPNNFIGFIF